MTQVAIAGDWHGNTAWALNRLQLAAAAGITTIYHVGDFGIWPGRTGKAYFQKLHAHLDEHDQYVRVVPGNHEDYNILEQMRLNDDGWLYRTDYPRLQFAPRGHTWLHAGVRFGALGGAGSIDRNIRNPGTEWWPAEEITDADCAALVANVTDRGWDRLDILLTHEAPAGVARRGAIPRPLWLTPEVEHYCWTQRVRLRGAVDTTAPARLFHGHWHYWAVDTLDGARPDGTDYTCQVLGLPADGDRRNTVVVDLNEYLPGGVADVTVLRLTLDER